MFLDAALMDAGSETWADGARAQSGCETKAWNTEMQIQGIIKTGSCTPDSSHSTKSSHPKRKFEEETQEAMPQEFLPFRCHNNINVLKSTWRKRTGSFLLLNLLNISPASAKGKVFQTGHLHCHPPKEDFFLNQCHFSERFDKDSSHFTPDQS